MTARRSRTWGGWKLEPSIGIPAAAAATGIADGLGKLREYFSDFRPEIRTMEINYAQRKSRINFQVSIPEGMRKKSRKIKIPFAQGYKIIEMIDDAFLPQDHHWRAADDHYVLDAKDLRSSSTYRVTLEAGIDTSALEKLVYVRPTLNRDNDDDNDNYWLESSIKQPNLLNKIYASLEVSDVNVGVVVDIEKMFGLTIPPEIKQTLDGVTRLLDASRHFDRNKVLREAIYYKKQARQYPMAKPDDFYRLINRVTDREVIVRHINLDRPYDISDIEHPQKYAGVVPQSLKIQVSAKLTLQSPIAEGYLRFQRKKYRETLRDEFAKLWPGRGRGRTKPRRPTPSRG